MTSPKVLATFRKPGGMDNSTEQEAAVMVSATTVALKKRPDDSGFTLVEMIVAMGIFAVLLAIFATAVQSFSATTVRTLRTSDQSTQARIVFNLFDKQVRAASA